MIKLVLSTQGGGAWLAADGRMLSATDYPDLYAMIGERFGGDGNGQFALPNLPSQEGTQQVMKVQKDGSEATYQGFVAQMVIWAGEAVPENWLPCDGRLIIGADYPLLQRVAAGQDGKMLAEFHLPQMDTLPGLQYIICVNGRDANDMAGAPKVDDDDY